MAADPERGAREVVRLAVESLAAAAAARGVAHLATTGGSAAPGLYRALLAPDVRSAVPWDRLHVWFGDDRFVPPGDPDSNVTPLDAILLAGDAGAGLSPAPLAPDRVHPVPVRWALADEGGPEAAATRYAAELRRLVAAGPAGLPVLDVVILGVGPDGHCLSVFPGSAAFDADPARIVLAIPAPTHVGPHLPRVTLHPALLGVARTIVVAAFGAAKADVLAAILDGARDERRLPAQLARRPGATWVLDRPAAAALATRS